MTGSLRMPAFSTVCFWLYAGFLAGYFLFPEAPEHYRYYYLFVLLPVLLRPAQALQTLRDDRALWLVSGYIAYMVATALWSTNFQWAEFATVAGYGVLVAGFFIATDSVYASAPERFDRMLRMLTALAALVGLVSILVWYAEHPFPHARLRPISRMSHEILAGCAYGFFALLALHFHQCSRERWLRFGFMLAFLVLTLTVIFTQSRTALVALIVAAALMTGRRGMISIAVVVLALAALVFYQPALWDGLTRSMPFRPVIWDTVLQQALDHLWFGTGYLSDTVVATDGRTFVHAHNAYLATLRDGGLIGLALLLWMLGVAALRAWRLDRIDSRVYYLALLVYGAVCAFPDLDRLLTRPKEHWLFFWLPLALVMIAWRCRQSGKSSVDQDQVPSRECM